MPRISYLSLFVCCTLATSSLFLARASAQDADQAKGAPSADAPSQDTAAGTDSFEQLHTRWTKLQKQMLELRTKYQTADADEQKAIREKFGTLIGESGELLPKLKTVALAAFEAEPNANVDVVGVLLGFMSNLNAEDRYEETLALGNKLVKGGSKAKGLADMMGVASYALDDFDAAQKYLDQASTEKAISFESRQLLEDIGEARKLWAIEKKVREEEAAADDLPRVEFTTNKGKVVVELYENEAPGAVGNFISLVEKKFYDGLTFHRVIGGFMAQGGCPEGTGTGGPGYNIFCELDKDDHRKHFRGTLSMAHAGKDTGGSQFFLTFRRTPHLDGKHTVFGRVVEGQDVLARLQRDPGGANAADKIEKAVVLRKRDHEYAPNKFK